MPDGLQGKYTPRESATCANMGEQCDERGGGGERKSACLKELFIDLDEGTSDNVLLMKFSQSLRLATCIRLLLVKDS